MIKLGISPCFEYEDKNRPVFGPKTLSYIENDMARYVSKEGVMPVLIPHLEDNILYPLIDEMDGIIMQGGHDIAPETYGETPIGKWKGDAIRDKFELKILDYAIKNSKPVFGICRGFQLMNVYFGGTLFQDTLTQNEMANEHRSAELYDTVKHPIYFEKGSLLDHIYAGTKNHYVNSVHHQAVKQLGNDLEIYAKSDDGLIEAFGYTKEKNGKVFGVQWHPEFSHTLKEEIINAEILLNAFLENCKS
ncbi:MAG: gamma-glutamyl-gamma-aminobutyrate hydrolase family protein [Reichenbachiella sp.]